MRLADIVTCVILSGAPAIACADEGMWTFNNFPSSKVQQAYGFAPDQTWLDHVRLSSIRLARGCSASLVSPHGLVLTNHHCARACIEQLSTGEHNYAAGGFYAKAADDEIRCPDMEANQLIEISDVTARVKTATDGKDGQAFADALKATEADIAKACSGGDNAVRCDVVDLYHGGVYNLYKYRRFQDVRLVAAPEESIAFFGGDPDNFEFPRYDLDFSLVRIYDGGQPLDSSTNYFAFAGEDAKEGDLVFTSGNPGGTDRLDTISELEYQRDTELPNSLTYLAEVRGVLEEFSELGPEQARIAGDQLFGVANSYKALKGRFAALTDPAILRIKRNDEAVLRARVAADPALKASTGAAWDNIRAAVGHGALLRDRFIMLEGGRGFNSRLFARARQLVRYAAESAKPDGERLREYTEANFPITRQSLLSNAPIYPELEKTTLRLSLTLLQRALGPDDPLVKTMFANRSPGELAADLIDGTTLKDPAVCRRLLNGGQGAIDAANDPLIAFAKLVDADARGVRKDDENNVGAVIDKNSRLIAQARFAIYGTSADPDATFTARLSYGAVKGYDEKGHRVNPFTTLAGAYARATGVEPFALPQSWIDAKPKLNLAQKLNICTTNDIIGGNSGSPVINRNAEVVGLIFDGNIQSLGGDFWFDPTVNRAVAVSTNAIREALSKIYHADRIVTELAHK